MSKIKKIKKQVSCFLLPDGGFWRAVLVINQQSEITLSLTAILDWNTVGFFLPTISKYQHPTFSTFHKYSISNYIEILFNIIHKKYGIMVFFTCKFVHSLVTISNQITMANLISNQLNTLTAVYYRVQCVGAEPEFVNYTCKQ